MTPIIVIITLCCFLVLSTIFTMKMRDQPERQMEIVFWDVEEMKEVHKSSIFDGKKKTERSNASS